MRMNKKTIISAAKRFWFIGICITYFLTNHWLLGNFILLYVGFRIGVFWKEYKKLVVKQGKVWKKEWGLNKDGRGLHENDRSCTKGYT